MDSRSGPKRIASPRTPDARSRWRVEKWEKQTGLVRDDYFASIPSLPISYDAARPILEALGGPNVPSGWQGGLPLAYHVGPGPVEVHFRIVMDYQVRPIWNVIATLKGSVEPDRWVMIGNHRDAWVYGAVDPGSGTAATLEMCRALGSAVKNGWKPRRTLVYASWDAEEYGLVGSTEWADEHAEELDEKAVLMLNVDSAVAGHDLDAQGIPSLRDLFLDAAGGVTDVRSGRPLRQLWLEKNRADWAKDATIELADPGGRSAPVGGSRPSAAVLAEDGPARVGIGLHGVRRPPGGAGDGRRLQRPVWGVSLDLRQLHLDGAARRPRVPHARHGGAALHAHRDAGGGGRGRPDDASSPTPRRSATTSTPCGGPSSARHARPARAGKPPMAFDGLPRLLDALRAFEAEAAALDRATRALAGRDGVPAPRLATVNDALMRVERAFLLPEGLPGRPWFKHAIYAPGLTTGYASWPLPGLYQAIQDDDPAMLATQTAALAARLDAARDALRAAKEAASDDGEDRP